MTLIVHGCPFCNADNVDIYEGPPGEFFVVCQECLAEGPITADVMESIAAWNAAPRFTAHFEP